VEPKLHAIQTWSATEVLREINFTNNTHTIIKGILHYLESGQNFDGKFWYKIVKSNNDYPHAPWWHTEIDSTDHNDYNPTACLAGFIIRFTEKNSELHKHGCRIAKEAFAQLLAAERENGMHTLSCYLRLIKYIEEAKATDIIDLHAVKAKLSEMIHRCITQNTAEWETIYVCKPSQFFDCPDSMFYVGNEKAAVYECDFIVKTQLDDGSWNITWNWADYPNQWAVSKNWWKANVIISNLLYLKGFGKL
jgi:hypothetical protein